MVVKALKSKTTSDKTGSGSGDFGEAVDEDQVEADDQDAEDVGAEHGQDGTDGLERRLGMGQLKWSRWSGSWKRLKQMRTWLLRPQAWEAGMRARMRPMAIGIGFQT